MRQALQRTGSIGDGFPLSSFLADDPEWKAKMRNPTMLSQRTERHRTPNLTVTSQLKTLSFALLCWAL
jgi:hypothetical protein